MGPDPNSDYLKYVCIATSIYFLQIMTATVESVVDPDLAPIIVAERIIGAIARAVTLPESELSENF